MIITSGKKLELNVVYYPTSIIVDNIEIPGQPVIPIRECTKQDYINAHPEDTEKLADAWYGYYFYEITTD